jgi:hypothetical protein
MKYTVRQFCILNFTFLILSSCAEKKSPATPSTDTTALVTPAIALTRETVQKQPVVSYSERTDNPLNDWHFSVKLYETRNTFHYLIKMQFEEIRGTDTLRLPNFGTMPEPVIRKGKEQYSCIIGFLDKDKQFREYKKVYVKNNVMRITALKHYAVTERSREVK